MILGRVVGPFGVKGEMKVEAYSDAPERFKQLRTVFLGADRAEHVVAGVRMHKGRALIRLEGIDTPEQVVALRTPDMAIPRSELPQLPDGHYYLDDVVGMEVVTQDGQRVGLVDDVLQTGSNDVFVVGTGPRQVLIPSIKDAVLDINMDVQRIVVDSWVLRND
jgi:16S rRNA processing protein RimM